MNMYFLYCFNAAPATARIDGASVLAARYRMPTPLNAKRTER